MLGLGEPVYLNQPVQPDLVGLHLLLGRLVPLQLGEDVGGVAVRLVLRHLELLLHPQQQLVRVSLELLQEKKGKSANEHLKYQSRQQCFKSLNL